MKVREGCGPGQALHLRQDDSSGNDGMSAKQSRKGISGARML